MGKNPGWSSNRTCAAAGTVSAIAGGPCSYKQDNHQCHIEETDIDRRQGQIAIARGFAFVLAVLGCAQLFTLVPPGISHLYAMHAWPVEQGTMQQSEERAFSSKDGWVYGVRDVFQVRQGTKLGFCRWDEPVTTTVQQWIDERLKPASWLWSAGSSVPLYVRAGGSMCEPVEGWRLALARTSFWLATGTATCFGTAIFLWIWQRRGTS